MQYYTELSWNKVFAIKNLHKWNLLDHSICLVNYAHLYLVEQSGSLWVVKDLIGFSL